MSNEYKIVVPSTNKNKIKKNIHMERGVIPAHPASMLFNGKVGSGKTILLHNILTRYHENYFSEIYLFSSSPDDIFDSFGIKDKNRFEDSKQWNNEIKKIFASQKADVLKVGTHKAKRILLIFEDIINEKSFMKGNEFAACFIRNRQVSISTWITSQSYTAVERKCRINMTCIYFFEGSKDETDRIVERYCPSHFTNNEFRQLIHHANGDDYAFLTIMNKKKQNEKFRKNLDIVLKL